MECAQQPTRIRKEPIRIDLKPIAFGRYPLFTTRMTVTLSDHYPHFPAGTCQMAAAGRENPIGAITIDSELFEFGRSPPYLATASKLNKMFDKTFVFRFFGEEQNPNEST